MFDCYASLILAECPTVLGRRMLPFSLWHSFALDAFNSPLMSDAEVAADDVVFAAWICSRGHADAVDVLRSNRDRIAAECEEWGRSVGMDECLGAAPVMLRYIAEFSKIPPRHGATGEPLPIPWQLACFYRLSAGRYDAQTAASIWDMPLNMAVALMVCRAVESGDQSYVDESTERAIEEAKRKLAEERGNNGNG